VIGVAPGRLRILLAGMLAGVPQQGGASWAVLQYVLGFRRLGHDVRLVEAVQPATEAPLAHTPAAAYFRDVIADYRLTRQATLLRSGTRETVGVPYDKLAAFARRADLLINVAGMLTDSELLGPIGLRAYLDLDPAFTQMWQAVEGIDMRLAGHHRFVTIGQNIGRSGCDVPACGVTWIPTLQPVVLDHWPVATFPGRHLTTVANWRGYGSITHKGVQYGQKAHSLRPLLHLPTRVDERFVLALGIHHDEAQDLAALAANGWQLLDPLRAAGTPSSYRRFVQGSRAEFGLAKSGYIAARCGWFSDRSVCYLASGRPVIAQDTGFGEVLPTGEGLLPFTIADDVLAAVDTLNTDEGRHRRAAREIAETYFDANRVLTRLLERLGRVS